MNLAVKRKIIPTRIYVGQEDKPNQINSWRGTFARLVYLFFDIGLWCVIPKLQLPKIPECKRTYPSMT